MRLAQWAGSVALAVACTAAGAGMHQICYEAIPENKNGVWVPNGIFGCAIDGGGWCTITPASTGFIPRANSYPLSQGVQAPGNFRYFDFSSSAGTFTARIDFFDGNGVKVADRSCTVNAGGIYSSERGWASPGAILTGFSTDASGLVTSGVWRLQANVDQRFNWILVQAPRDFIAVGGGAIGTESPTGALIARSMRDQIYAGDSRTWSARTSEAGGAAQPHRTTAFVIGLRIEGLAGRDLAPLLQVAASTSGPTLAAHPTSQATQAVIGGSVVIGGGIDARAQTGSPPGTQLGQFATLSAPLIGSALECWPAPWGGQRCRSVPAITGWRGESKDHVISAPGWISVEMLALPPTITVGGTTFKVQARHVTATSAETAHPAADVGGLRGEFALTGIGATVDWRRFNSLGTQVAAGNLLWKLEPRADLGGASVASKDHIISSPATVTAHAIGIKLVP